MTAPCENIIVEELHSNSQRTHHSGTEHYRGDEELNNLKLSPTSGYICPRQHCTV
jgi:hypothetical protein